MTPTMIQPFADHCLQTRPLAPSERAKLAHLLDSLTLSPDPSALHESFDWQTFITLSQQRAALRMRAPFAQGAWTPLHCTAFRGKAQYAAVLLARGSDPDAVDASLERTPLHVCASAARWRQTQAVETAEVLLRYGANVNAEMVSGKSALVEAVSGGCVGMVRVLLAAGADITSAVKHGNHGERRTALYLALYINSETIVRMLLEGGASFASDISLPTIASLASDFADVRHIVRDGTASSLGSNAGEDSENSEADEVGAS